MTAPQTIPEKRPHASRIRADVPEWSTVEIPWEGVRQGLHDLGFSCCLVSVTMFSWGNDVSVDMVVS